MKKSFLKVSMILLVMLALVIGSNALYAGLDDVKKEETKKGCPQAAEKKVGCQATCKAEGIKCEYKTVYVCPVEGCKYKSDKPGECPTCKKELEKKEVCCMTVYVCPVEGCKYKSDKPGECPACKKELVKKDLCCLKAYVCPVDGCKYHSDKAGKCPKCSKELVEKEFTKEYHVLYVCPEEKCPYKAKEPGKCPKCGKELIMASSCCMPKGHAHAEMKHEGTAHETKELYVCPMEKCGVKSDTPGKCPKCGMELKKV